MNEIPQWLARPYLLPLGPEPCILDLAFFCVSMKMAMRRREQSGGNSFMGLADTRLDLQPTSLDSDVVDINSVGSFYPV